jgi:hypothetical protein
MMMASDVEDDRSRSGSPDYSGGEHEGIDMAEQSDEREGSLARNGSKPNNTKDPSRPRRKKARRACYACQRAHLTCGMLYYSDLSFLRILTVFPRRRKTVPEMYQTWPTGCMSRWSQEESKVPARCSKRSVDAWNRRKPVQSSHCSKERVH